MILIFDMDDTLYDERTYVDSGLRAVASYGEERFGWNSVDSFNYMQHILETSGRGRIFDLWLASHGRCTRSLVKACVKVYRHHAPSLRLTPGVEGLLEQLSSDYSLYLVTDGHKIVQHKKVEALGISRFFQKVLITHRYGIRNAKPSTYCFELIRRREKCLWEDMVYIGDNPEKDFVNLNPLGVKTIRVNTGVYRNVKAKPGYDAAKTLERLDLLLEEVKL
jgi:putative hydrolase of the HAD superfamily